MSKSRKGLRGVESRASNVSKVSRTSTLQHTQAIGGWRGGGREGQKTLPVQMDLVCFSHLRWDFVFQRPQHLLTRCARTNRVFFVEEPVFDQGEGSPSLEIKPREERLWVATPHLPHGLTVPEIEAAQRLLVDQFFADQGIEEFALWYYTPMALSFTRHLKAALVVFDCMDELSAFAGAPLALRERESELFSRADLVFTGGQSLYESKRDRHPSVHAFPSSIDVAHFSGARAVTRDPEDQRHIDRPRLGFFGVIDERLDTELLAGVAAYRPDWQFVIVGPVVKIDPASLPKAPNIHYLGGKSYGELPAYLSGWDVALMPFARNESTRFISPTKTPEYLAAGRPVVSTSIRDVVRPYGKMGLVEIADTVEDFSSACARALKIRKRDIWLASVDAFLANTSWDRTWENMAGLMASALESGRAVGSAPRGSGDAAAARVGGRSRDLSSGD